jgi:DnaJ-class molecular chaperone
VVSVLFKKPSFYNLSVPILKYIEILRQAQATMTENIESTPKHHTPCPGCGGSGQTSYFGGASRFMLSWEDCPDCCGTGVVLEKTNSDQEDNPEAKDN